MIQLTEYLTKLILVIALLSIAYLAYSTVLHRLTASTANKITRPRITIER